MISEESGQSSELNSYHCDVDPSLGTGFGLFVIPDEATMAHEPTEGPFHNPTPREDFEAARAVAAFDHRHRQFWPQPANPLGKVRPAVAAIHPKVPQPGQPVESLPKQI